MTEKQEFEKLTSDAPEMMRSYGFSRKAKDSGTETRYLCWMGFIAGDKLLFAIEPFKRKPSQEDSQTQVLSEEGLVPEFNPKGNYPIARVIPVQIRQLKEGPVLYLHCSPHPYIRKALIQGWFADTQHSDAGAFLQDIRFAKSQWVLSEPFRNRTVSRHPALKPATAPFLCEIVGKESDGTKSCVCLWIDLVRDLAKTELPGFLRIFAGVKSYAGFPAESRDRKWGQLDDAGARYEYELALPVIGDKAYTEGERIFFGELFTISVTEKMEKIEIVPGKSLLEVIENLMINQWLPAIRKNGPLCTLVRHKTD